MSAITEVGSLIAPAIVPVAQLFYGSRANLPPLSATTTDPVYVTLIETGGAPPEYTQDTPGAAYTLTGLQITCRAKSYVSARETARLIYNALCLVRNQTIGSTWYLAIYPRQEPFDMGLDDVGRVRVVFNALAWKRPS